MKSKLSIAIFAWLFLVSFQVEAKVLRCVATESTYDGKIENRFELIKEVVYDWMGKFRVWGNEFSPLKADTKMVGWYFVHVEKDVSVGLSTASSGPYFNLPWERDRHRWKTTTLVGRPT